MKQPITRAAGESGSAILGTSCPMGHSSTELKSGPGLSRERWFEMDGSEWLSTTFWSGRLCLVLCFVALALDSRCRLMLAATMTPRVALGYERCGLTAPSAPSAPSQTTATTAKRRTDKRHGYLCQWLVDPLTR